MTALVPRRGLEVAVWNEPTLGILEGLVHQRLHPHPDIAPMAVTDAHREAAQAALSHLAQYLVPASLDAIRAWMWPIADAVRVVPSEDEFLRKTKVLHLAAGDVPRVAWTEATQGVAMRTMLYWPSVADVLALVTPPIQPMLERVRVLRVIATASG